MSTETNKTEGKGVSPVVEGQTTAFPAPTASPSSLRALWRHPTVGVNLARAAVFVFFVGAWGWSSDALISSFYISHPRNVGSQVWAWIVDGTLWFHTWITLQETVLGLLFGISSGIIAGFIIGPLRALGKVLDPFLLMLYSIPKLALAPLFLVWFGIGLNMKVILSAVIVFFLVFFNTVAGVRGVDMDLVNAVRLMGGTKRDVTLKVVVPAAAASILTGVRIAIPYGLIGAVVGELIASNRGIGYLILSSSSRFNTAGVFAALVVLAVIATLLNAVVTKIENVGPVQ